METVLVPLPPCLLHYTPCTRGKVKLNRCISFLSVQFFTSRIDNNSLAVCLIVGIVGILDVFLVLHQLACGADQIGLILVGEWLVFGAFLGSILLPLM